MAIPWAECPVVRQQQQNWEKIVNIGDLFRMNSSILEASTSECCHREVCLTLLHKEFSKLIRL